MAKKMNQTEILDRLKAGGKMGLQFIDEVKYSHGDDADISRENAQKELWELHRKGLVKYTRGASGQLDMWEAIQ